MFAGCDSACSGDPMKNANDRHSIHASLRGALVPFLSILLVASPGSALGESVLDQGKLASPTEKEQAGQNAAAPVAAGQFRIPNERTKALVGAWVVVMMGEGEGARAVPAEKAMALVFRADGSGVQRKGGRETPIIWGGEEKGTFAFQWKQDGGNGDGVMGTWKATKEGVRLAIREYEDGKDPEGDEVVLILEREK